MAKQTLADLSEKEFDELIEGYIERGDDQMEMSTFFEVMAALEEKRASNVVELTGTFADGDVTFDATTPLPVDKNTIYVGDTKIVLKLRPEAGNQKSA